MQSRLAQLGLDPEDFAAGPQRLHALQLADPSLGSFFDAAQFAQLRGRFEQLVAATTAPDLPLESPPSFGRINWRVFISSPDSRAVVSAEFWLMTWASVKRCKRSFAHLGSKPTGLIAKFRDSETPL